jgi:pyruvate carboxylase
MDKALREYVILGVKTSTPFLIDLINSKHFYNKEIFTDFIDRYFGEWKPREQDIDAALIAYIVDELSGKTRPSVAQTPEGHLSPWETLGNWRLG